MANTVHTNKNSDKYILEEAEAKTMYLKLLGDADVLTGNSLVDQRVQFAEKEKQRMVELG